MIHLRLNLIALLLFLQALVAYPASAEIRQVDGNLWLNSSVAERQAYLIGVANIVQVHQALQRRHGRSTEGAPIDRILAAMDANSVKTVADNITAWYESNRDKRGMPVLGLIWLRFVETTRTR